VVDPHLKELLDERHQQLMDALMGLRGDLVEVKDDVKAQNGRVRKLEVDMASMKERLPSGRAKSIGAAIGGLIGGAVAGALSFMR